MSTAIGAHGNKSQLFLSLSTFLSDVDENCFHCDEAEKEEALGVIEMSHRGSDAASLDLGFDIQEMVAQRLAVQNKRTVQLEQLLRETKFTKEEIRTMYRGFKQVRSHSNFPLLSQIPTVLGGQMRYSEICPDGVGVMCSNLNEQGFSSSCSARIICLYLPNLPTYSLDYHFSCALTGQHCTDRVRQQSADAYFGEESKFSP